MLGDFGHLSIIIGFVASIVSCISYGQSLGNNEGNIKWQQMGRIAYSVHLFAVFSACAVLFFIIYSHQYQYQYAWKHASNALPVYYVISCFWEGQEGSFMIWTLWNAIIGQLLIRKSGDNESGVLLTVSVVQTLLLSMILGVFILPELKVGSSPFMLLKEVLNDPIYSIDPDFIPEDGTGLNPLLQNIWMVIHPPIIFLGFSLSMVPFAFALVGVFKPTGFNWLKSAKIWLTISIGVLGMGIMMGAYWAYETLNFGGYWNWDPVENAILIPWLVMIAALHGILIFEKRKKGFQFTMGLLFTSYVLIVYSTFLTRSGILGDSSVHSFTDLGLSGQLLVFLLISILVTIIAVVKLNNRDTASVGSSVYNIEFWIMLGMALLCLSAFQILMPTSIPVFSSILNGLGLESNMAPPADPVAFYSKFQLWFAFGFGPLMGVGQMMYWHKIRDIKKAEDHFVVPIIFTLIVSSLVILALDIKDWKYILVVISVVFGVVVCANIIYSNFTKNKQLIGGPLSHIGFAIMILGFVISSGYAEMISRNVSISAPESSLPLHNIQENVLLNRNQSKVLGSYAITYRGVVYEDHNGSRIDKEHLFKTNYQDTYVVKSSSESFDIGDTIKVNPTNTYYQLEVATGDVSYTLYPRMQNNASMGYLASPDILSFWNKDLYVHVSNFPDPEKITWSAMEKFPLKMGEVVNTKGLKITFTGTSILHQMPGVSLTAQDMPIEAKFLVEDGQERYSLSSVYLIKDNRVRIYPGEIEALGLKMSVSKITPATGQIITQIQTSQRDWITLKAKEMPMINLVWIGTIIMLMGISWSVRQQLVTRNILGSNFRITHRSMVKNKIPINEERLSSNA